ncbi:hypothetical protein A3F34_00975 [Candidatus Roizmanbacteria bacterium RIFCSPHIGHO2_12_FULL_44_10]|uniref:Addiction module toxin RelE n=1 Tax=Candidatus Roizmanbacteria bacterium RIFCSPHIGHO2_12_FULL_44_10 TaxID=1802054 RepID=A0A1F7I7M9_9BACT|nr:MAG: hypothetical protein A3F34_00975 [Candidatus Roizmanbacteria bacterium RIFCSPHIGHO2_12_FULL_44_10]
MSVAKNSWSIEYYGPPNGDISPVAVFIEKLPEKAQAKLSNIFDLLKEFGSQVGPPHIKKLVGLPLWEIRILGQHSARILYIIPKSETFLLLHGFIKKKQKTPRREINIAISRLNEYKSRL